MKTGKYWTLAAVAIGSVLILSARLVGVSTSEKQQLEWFGVSTLSGLKIIQPIVMFEPLDANFKFAHFKNELQTQMNSALRKAGIKLVAERKNLNDVNLGQLVVVVGISKISIERKLLKDTYVFGVQTGLYQLVQLSRDLKVRAMAQTWSETSFPAPSMTVSNKIGHAIKDEVAVHLKEFINDYLAANPKDEQMVIGTVRYLDFEGGFYGLVADNGEKYDPVNLPKEYKQDGLRVKFQVREKKGMVGFRMWGKIAEVVKIEKL